MRAALALLLLSRKFAASLRIPFTVLLLTACGPAPKVSLATCITPLGMETDLDCAAVTAHEAKVATAHERRTGLDPSALRGWRIVLRGDAKWSEKHQRLVFTEPSKPGWVLWGFANEGTKTISIADTNFASGALTHELCHVLGVWDHGAWESSGCAQVERDLAPAAGEFLAGPYEGEWLGADKQMHFGVSAALTLGGHAMLANCTTADCLRLAPWVRALLPPLFALGTGLAKETLDHFAYGGFSRRDLVADVVGVAVGHLLWTGIRLLFPLSLPDGSVAHGVWAGDL